jgi:hypothetical protein
LDEELSATVQAAFGCDPDYHSMQEILFDRQAQQLELAQQERDKYKRRSKRYRQINANLKKDLAFILKKPRKEVVEQQIRHNAELEAMHIEHIRDSNKLEAMRTKLLLSDNQLKYTVNLNADLITICRALQNPEKPKSADALEAAKHNFPELFASSSDSSRSKSGSSHD